MQLGNDSHLKSTFARIKNLQIPENHELSIVHSSLASLSRKKTQLETKLLETSCLFLFSDCGALRLSGLQLFHVASEELGLDDRYHYGFRCGCARIWVTLGLLGVLTQKQIGASLTVWQGHCFQATLGTAATDMDDNKDMTWSLIWRGWKDLLIW